MDQVDHSRWKELEASKRKILSSDKDRRLRQIATSSRRNPKAVWKYLKKNNSSDSIRPIPIPDEEEKYIVDTQDKAEFISLDFSEVHTACTQHCLPSETVHGAPINVEPPETLHCPPLQLTTSSILELRRLDMSKASGSFLINNRLLKIAETTILYPLSRLFNLIISKRQYPTAWKQTEVIPVPKKGSSTFRPISLLQPLSKLFEKLVAVHLHTLGNSNHLLSDSVSASKDRPKCSCFLWPTNIPTCSYKKKKSKLFFWIVPKPLTSFHIRPSYAAWQAMV
ncbi:hypothetical protein RvY_12674-2 [Ramazzottius varieornatus]|uniref:Reverse transcriptase domain-containing protein n=1 Tax=Ramazzottius varieornatus TaxID=947166 RepID=A0A1D1VMA4_RAMVA|nr:hypothetical protein RvY_12674-2 [Ramazzottius varieornatus]